MRPFLKICFFNVFFLLIVLLLVEAVFGNWFSNQSYGAMTIPRNVTWTFDATQLYDKGGLVTYHRDDHGLRGQYPSPDKITILTIGGSTTDQRYIDDHDTWQNKLVENFAQAGKKIYIANAGVDGQSTRGHLYSFDIWFPLIPDLAPQYILAYIGVNDLHIELKEEFDTMKSNSFKYQIYHTIRNNSILFRAFSIIKGILQANQSKIIHGTSQESVRQWAFPEKDPDLLSLEKANQKRLMAYEQRVRKLISKIRALGAKAIITTQNRADYHMRNGRPLGSVDQNGTVTLGLYGMQTLFNQRAMKACQDMQAICLDAGSDLELSEEDFYDSIHNTPSGANKLAQYLFKKLEPRISTP